MPSSTHGRLAVWTFLDGMAHQDALQFAADVERLGYESLWIPETFGRDPFVQSAELLGHTEHLVLATGIANIFNRHAGAMKQAARTLSEQASGRFVLGLGVSHPRTVETVRGLRYERPLAAMRHYLEAYADAPWRGPESADPPCVLAALGPRMLALAAEQAAGAHTYSVTPVHTAAARAALGPDAVLAVEQKVVLSTDRDAGLDAARQALRIITPLPNYRRSWQSLGFSEEQIDALAPEFVDAVVAVGDADVLAARIRAHLDAGASTVCVQPLDPRSTGRPDLGALKELAPIRP